MATLHIESTLPHISPAQGLDGWRREFCVQFLDGGAARIFVRAVEASSFKASELQRATLFHRLTPRFDDLSACVDALRPDLDRLAETARLIVPDKDNLFATVEFDRTAWERVQLGLDRWSRRAASGADTPGAVASR